jgi:hypothetical protein
MNTYRMKVSSKDMATTIHSLTCSVVVNGTGKTGVHSVEAVSAKQAAQDWDRDNDTLARGIKATKICPCCHE